MFLRGLWSVPNKTGLTSESSISPSKKCSLLKSSLIWGRRLRLWAWVRPSSHLNPSRFCSKIWTSSQHLLMSSLKSWCRLAASTAMTITYHLNFLQELSRYLSRSTRINLLRAARTKVRATTNRKEKSKFIKTTTSSRSTVTSSQKSTTPTMTNTTMDKSDLIKY